MEPNNNKNSAAPQQLAQQENSKTIAHPLQEIPLKNEDAAVAGFDNVDHAVINSSGMLPQHATVNSKSNWVKFDDEGSSNANGYAGDTENNNKAATAAAAAATENIAENFSHRQQQQQQQHTTNKLAHTQLPPPPPSNKHSSATASTAQENQKSTTAQQPDVSPAVLSTEITHVNLNASGSKNNNNSSGSSALSQQGVQPSSAASYQKAKKTSSAGSAAAATSGSSQQNGMSTANNSVAIPIDTAAGMRTIELSTGTVREGFANGDIIVTLLPANTKWPWITPAIFRPELVPEELMAQGLTLTVEDYVHIMETLVNDYRFTVYNICYKRILVCWILFAFAVLLTMLFSGLQGVALFSLGVGWLFLNAAAIFFCMWVKLRLSRGLEKCLARVNRQLLKHKILLVLDDRGRISCHKVNLCFMYFDSTQCVNFLNEFLEQTEQNGGEAIKAGWEKKLDIDLDDIVIQGSNPVRLSRKQAVAQELFLTYLQRWGKEFLRRRLDWVVQEAGVHETPRHLQSSLCPCQYEEDILRNKIKIHLKGNQCCGINCIGCWL